MDFILKWLILLWSSGVQTEAKRNSSEHVAIRLTGGANRCVGALEMKLKNVWKPVDDHSFGWNLGTSATVCRQLDCGSVVSARLKDSYSKVVWKVDTASVQSDSAPTEYVLAKPLYSSSSVEITCSESVRLVDGTTLCSGRVELREPNNVRLVEGGSHCGGRLELKLHGEWKPVDGKDEELQKSAALVCRQLKCGSVVSIQIKSSAIKYAWGIFPSRVQSQSTLREYVSLRPWYSPNNLEVACSDLLYQPIISISPSINRVDMSPGFTISCSIKPQYPGGFFQLIVFTSSSTRTYTQKAVNHTARFLLPAVHNSHHGNYSCVYHINVFSHDFSSQSQLLSLSIPASPVDSVIRLGLILTVALFLSAIYFHKKATGGQKPGGQEKIGLNCCHLSASRAEAQKQV